MVKGARKIGDVEPIEKGLKSLKALKRRKKA